MTRNWLAGDVRLTMGGEPTFVSIDDMDGEEWNTAALGAAKQRMASELLLRLRQEFGKGGLLHYGQGKWYPGEPLPRWTFSLLLANRRHPALERPSLACLRSTATMASASMRRASLRRNWPAGWKSDPNFVINAYEDPLAYLLKERKLPANVDLLDNKLDDPLEREKLRQVFERGLGQPVGYVLPLKRAEREKRSRVAELFVDAAFRAPLLDPRRFAGGPPPAARNPHLGACRGKAKDFGG